MKDNDKAFMDKVVDFYYSTIGDSHPQGNMSEVAEHFGITRAKVNKILITVGVIDSPLHRDIMALKAEGYDNDEIASALGVSSTTVKINIPYEKVIYNGEEKSAGAVYVEEYRKREKIFLNSVVRKKDKMEAANTMFLPDQQMEKFVNLLKEQGLFKPVELEDDPIHLLPEFTKEESKLFKMAPDVILLHIELDDEIDEADRALCGLKYGKSISRDIMVPLEMPLHNLHYAINQAFGFTNSHLHEYELSEEDLKWVTKGKVSNWKKLIGLVFKNPIRDEERDFWDDDYEGGSPKKWMRSKYTGPHYNRFYEEGYRFIRKEIENLEVKSKKLEDLVREFDLNPFAVNETLPISNIMEIEEERYSIEEFYETLKEDIKYAQAFPDTSLSSQPDVCGFAGKLHYTYDFGDNWRFTITPSFDASYLVEKGIVTGNEIKNVIQKVCTLARPVMLAFDGYPLVDDVGGTSGYVEMLKQIDKGDEDIIAWAEGMGWKKKISKDVL